MDYKPLIEQAKERNQMSDYGVAKALGYKDKSVIYRIKRGTAGMSAKRLMRLMQLAGKTLAVAALTSAALLSGSGANERENAQHDAGIIRAAFNTSIHYAKSAMHRIMDLCKAVSLVKAWATCPASRAASFAHG